MALPTKTRFPNGGANDTAVAQQFAQFAEGVSGNVRFVHSSGAGTTGPGWAPGNAYTTLQSAHDACTSDNGDVIIVLQGHAESLGAASAITISKTGITIIGLGSGANRPTFTWHTTDATMLISGANCTIRNVVTTVDVDEVVSMISVTAANCTLDRVDFREGTSAQAIQWLLTTNAADFLTIQNCTHYQLTAAAAAQKWIQLVGPDHTRIIDNTFKIVANASTSSQLIAGTTAVIYCEIARNLILWIGATINTIVNLATGSTGIISNNHAGSGTSVSTAGAFTGDGCFMFQNFWADTAAASGLLAPLVDTDT